MSDPTSGTAVAGDPPAASPETTAPRRRPLGRRLAVPAVLFVVALAFSACFFHEAWAHPTTTWKGDLGDPEQFQLFLAWTPHALAHGLNPFVTHAVLYPQGANLMWNTAVFLPSLLVSPVTVLFGPTVAYDVLMLLAVPVTAVAAYAAFRRWSGPAGAAVGGLLFAMCPFFVAHAAGHLHLMLLALVPLVLLLVDEIVVRQRWRAWRAGAWLGVVAAAQLLTASEVLALDVLVAAIGVALLALARPRAVTWARLRHVGLAGAVAVAVFGALAAYPLYVPFFGPYRVGHPIHLPGWYVNDVAGVIVPTGQYVGWSLGQSVAKSWTGGAAEWNGYVGIPMLVVALVVVALRWRRPAVWFPAAMAAIALLLSFGPQAHVDGHPWGPPLPWRALTRAPLLGQVLPARFGLYVGLFAAALMAVAVDEVWRSGRAGVAFAGGLAVGAVVVSWLPDGWPTTTVPTPAYFRSAQGVGALPDGSVAVVLPLVDGPATEHAELWQARAGFRFSMPEGYLIVPGPHQGPPTATFQAFAERHPGTAPLPAGLASAVRAEWRGWGVRAVVVAPGHYDQEAAVSDVAGVLGERPVWHGDTAVFAVAG